ncbi:hypothetical protein TNCV_2580261 [Trichonephila clavipes]|uniref:Uncharacterized protein n=1 Tax=Trichonephila clavipes TaxID=2585209 RepID=A0A8X6S708_TRICX|nr:hypothetical protein TNCV_2580261 [Trichonephila clavipes]
MHSAGAAWEYSKTSVNRDYGHELVTRVPWFRVLVPMKKFDFRGGLMHIRYVVSFGCLVFLTPGFVSPSSSSKSRTDYYSSSGSENSSIFKSRDRSGTVNNIITAYKNSNDIVRQPYGRNEDEHHTRLGNGKLGWLGEILLFSDSGARPIVVQKYNIMTEDWNELKFLNADVLCSIVLL